MNELAQTRRTLHGVAESVIAGPQHRQVGTIRLRATPGGFGGLRSPWRVDGVELTDGEQRVPLTGTFRALAAAAGVDFGPPIGVYGDTTGVEPDEPVLVDQAAAGQIAGAFAVGDHALRAFAPDAQPTLWPEHFDLAITLDEVNYGVSPGDTAIPVPYAYVGPWQVPSEGEFWNAPFGAARELTGLGDADAVAAFFAEGARLAAQAHA